jgi:hypothetical protein
VICYNVSRMLCKTPIAEYFFTFFMVSEDKGEQTAVACITTAALHAIALVLVLAFGLVFVAVLLFFPVLLFLLLLTANIIHISAGLPQLGSRCRLHRLRVPRPPHPLADCVSCAGHTTDVLANFQVEFSWRLHLVSLF